MRHEMTLRDLAEATGYAYGTVRKVAAGQTDPWPAFVAKVTEVLGENPWEPGAGA